MWRKLLTRLLPAVAFLAAVRPCLSEEVAKPVRILWAGSSSIYYHNQPKLCAEWLTRFGGMSAVSELVGRSGTGVHVYLRPDFKPEYGLKPKQTILEKIAGEKYDHVVLQVPAEFIAGPEGEEHDRSLDVYCRAIRGAGGEPVFYEMGWGRDETAEVGRSKIFAAAVRNQVSRFAPCSTAWARVRRERPDLDLQNPPDKTHPGTLGCYLNLCCFVAALTDERPQGLPHELAVWRHLSDKEKQAAGEAMQHAEFDTYDSALPSWMRRMAFMATPATIGRETAGYLQDVAWSECEAARKRLAAAIPQATAHQFLRDWNDPEIGKRIDRFGEEIATGPEEAEGVIRMLAKDPSTEAATLRAELLVWIARGDETPSWKLKTMAVKPRPMETGRFGPLAGELLLHRDPFVRGLAEWAIAIRLHAEYECAEQRVDGRRVARQWPGEDAPGWYRTWAAIGPEEMLDFDYVRQAAALGVHRTTAGLLAAARDHVDRADHLIDYAEQVAGDTRAAYRQRVLAAYDKLNRTADDSPGDLTLQRSHYLDLRHAVRDVVLASPDIRSDSILFGLRQAPPGNGNITVGRWNTHTPGGDIYLKRGLSPEDPAEPLLHGRLGPGHVRGLELHWDADRVVFAYARQGGRANPAQRLPEKSDFGGYFGQGVGAVEEMSHLFEMNIDGSQLRQLTDERLHADQEPTYLPNDDIAFVSDRSYFGSQCAGALEQDNMILNLYRCDGDGRNIRALSNNKDFDRHPHVMDTGQLLFLHWEYQERHLWQTHTLWTCRPDGKMTDALYKQHIPSGPMSLREARQIFGHRKLVAIACGHHNDDQGAVFLVDYAQGINERDAMRNVTPGVSGTEGGYGGIKPVEEGGVSDGGGHYMFPYPLSQKSFLVAYSYKRPDRNAGQNFSLYYIDVWGNKELIHRDKRMSVAFLSPVKKVARPQIVDESRLADSLPRDTGHALALVTDVQAGWPDTSGRKVKYLRISQKVPWPCVKDDSKSCGFNDLHWMPAAWDPVLGMWDWGAARVIGIVPVEEDGSAYFEVPADQTVYFHALDETFLELRRMRSNVTFTAAETRACVGCHESRATAPATGAMPLALRRDPSVPEPPPWGDRIVPDYERHIQPIFDRHCTGCHGAKEPDGGLELTSRRIDGYLQSYRTIFGLKPEQTTPFAKNYWSIWRPNELPISDAQHNAAKAFLKNVLRDPPADQLVKVADYTGGAEITQPKQFGSATSKLTLTLLSDPLHRDEVKLSRAEWISLVTWVDLNAQYWGTFVEKDGHYASRRREGPVVPPRRVDVIFPDPWTGPPAGEWRWLNDRTAALK